jgi:hypothetical protein
MGRFLSRDTYPGPDTSPMTLNNFNYVLSNPGRYYDPTGHINKDPSEINEANGILADLQLKGLINQWC